LNNLQQLSELMTLAKSLPPDDKAQLIKELLGTSGMAVIFGNGLSTAEIVTQIQTMEEA